MASIHSCLAAALAPLALALADCEAPSSGKALLQSKVHVEDSEHGTVDKSGACDYDVYIGRSDWGWDKHWAKRIVSAPKGETFHFDGCREDAGCGSGGIHVLRDSNGYEVGTGTCCSGLTNKVLRVISNACTDKCLYTLDIYRGGPDNFAKWFQKNSTKPRGETFAFTGCITDTNNGQKCVTDYNVADGIRYYTDFIGNRIGTGTCCNSETNKVEIAEVSCPKSCSYTLQIISRYAGYTSLTGHEEMDLGSSNSISSSKLLEDAENEEFTVDGCSTTIPQGKACKDQHGVSGGVRVIKNKKGQIVATGDCCASDARNDVKQVNGACTSR